MSESKVIKARIAKVSPYKPENGINRFRILIDYRLESSPSRRRIFSQVVKAKNIVLAQEHAETLRYEVKKGQHVPFEEETEELPVIKTKALTLEEAYPEYEKRMKDRGRQELTIFNTKRLFELHIFPVLGNYPVDDIDGNAINETLKTSLNRKIANGEITKRTAKFFMARLKSCLQTLHVKGLRAKPCPPIETFGKDEDKALSPYKNKVISEEQFQAALNLAHQLGPVYVVFLLLGGHCGLRLGEIMGLAW
ncbi:MAG TPA: hypothetical protein VHC69_32440, partial [Polyangiaceae bacterium]|nr:hypothetical protein [Polyangiaceae bacterium]